MLKFAFRSTGMVITGNVAAGGGAATKQAPARPDEIALVDMLPSFF